jgi:hypothetical protein
MQDEVSRKRAKLPSAEMIIAIIALIAALGGTAYAAGLAPQNSVGAKQLKGKSVTTGKIANGAVNGSHVADKSLTGEDINLNALGTVPSASNAAQTGNAGTITGHQAACPPGTTLIRGVCFDSSSNPEVTSVLKARDACAAKGGYLPSPLKLRSTKDVLNLGTGVGTDLQYTDTYYDKPYETPKEEEEEKVVAPSTIVVDGKGTMTEQSVTDNAEFICSYPLVR